MATLIQPIRQVKVKDGIGKWDYNALLNLPDLTKITSENIDNLLVTFDEATRKLTIKNPAGTLDAGVDLSSLVRSGGLTSVELTETDALGNPGLFLKFVWEADGNTSVTYTDITRLSGIYTEGTGIIITQSETTGGNVISIDASYIKDLVREETLDLVDEKISKAIDEARQRWIDVN